jgi:CPA2 family monovalent cation:H+ antiporter-2
VLRRLRDARIARYRSMPGGYFPGVTDEESGEHDQPRLRTILVGESAAAVGKPLQALNLGSMDVQVTAVRRTGQRQVNPSGDEVVRAGDVLVLLGTQENLGKAEIRVLQG